MKTASQAEQKLKDFHEEAALEKKPEWQLMLRLWPFVRPYKKWLWLSLAALLLTAMAQLLRPLLMGQGIAHATQKQSRLLFVDVGWLALTIVGGQVVVFVQMYLMQKVGAHSMADLRAHTFVFLQRLRLRVFDRTPVGRLVTRVTNDVDALGELFGSGVLNALGDFLTLVGIVIIMLWLDWRLALISFAVLPLVGFLVAWVRSRAKQAYRDIRVKTARLNAFLNEQINGVAVVQAYAKEEAMQQEFDAINQAYRDANKRSVWYEALMDAAIEMLNTLCIASILWWVGVQQLGAHPVSFALVVTFTQYLKQFFEPISSLAQRYTILQSALSGAERVFQLLDEPDVEPLEIAPGEYQEPTRTEPGANVVIQLDHVNFSYKPGVPVLQDINLSVRKGETVALVGATGAGKTTVISLLLRLYEAQEGELRVYDKSIRMYTPAALRRLFSVVPQDVILFSGSLLSNIALGESAPDRARAQQALERIGAWAWVQERLGGLDAVIEERGGNLSAGERQLLAFARAVYRDAPLLVLDEATANLDSSTEARLQHAMEATQAGRTTLVIAHRLATIRAADRIVVFHRGRIVETGRHEELLAHNGLYRRLYQLQFVHPADASSVSIEK